MEGKFLFFENKIKNNSIPLLQKLRHRFLNWGNFQTAIKRQWGKISMTWLILTVLWWIFRKCLKIYSKKLDLTSPLIRRNLKSSNFYDPKTSNHLIIPLKALKIICDDGGGGGCSVLLQECMYVMLELAYLHNYWKNFF